MPLPAALTLALALMWPAPPRFTADDGTGSILAVAWSPDGKFLATGGAYPRLDLWDAATGKRVASLGRVSNSARCLAFSPDGKTLACDETGGTVAVWDVPRQRLRYRVEVGSSGAVAFSPDGELLAFGTSVRGVVLLKAENGVVKRRFPAEGMFCGAVAFSPDGRWLAAGCHDGRCDILEMPDGDCHYSFRRAGRARAFAFAPDSRTVAAGADGSDVLLLDLATMKTRELAGTRAPLNGGVAFDPAGRLLYVGRSDGGVTAISLSSGRQAMCFAAKAQRSARALAVSPGGGRLAAVMHSGADGVAVVWDVPAWLRDTASGLWERQPPVEGHTGAVLAVAFAPAGSVLASAGAGGAVRLWGADRGVELAALRGHSGDVRALAFTADGQTLASGGADRTVRLWRVKDGAELATLRGLDGVVLALDFAPGGQTLAVALSDGTVRLRGLTGDRAVLAGHRGPVYAATFTCDGAALLSGGSDGQVIAWDVAKAAERSRFDVGAPVRGLALGRDGATLAVVTGEGVRLWDWRTGRALTAWERPGGLCWQAALSPRDPLLAVASAEGLVLLDRQADGLRRRPTDGPDGPARCVAFSADGRFLAAGGAGRVVSLWRRVPAP
jgi:WD40 repeat protein